LISLFFRYMVLLLGVFMVSKWKLYPKVGYMLMYIYVALI